MKEPYKFSVIKQDRVNNVEGFPNHFLANTLEEAEEVYKEYKGLLDNFAYTYSVSTGLDKHDLFGYALIGLAKAKRDWDPTRSNNFKTFAIFNIKDELNEALRENSANVVIPSYIRKALSNVKRLGVLCSKYGASGTSIVSSRKVPDNFFESDKVLCEKSLENLVNSAKRAKVEYSKFIERIYCIPAEVSYENQTIPEKTERDQQILEAAMLVEQLKNHMDEDELIICTGIMSGDSYEEISTALNKSPAWISKKLQAFRDKVLQLC